MPEQNDYRVVVFGAAGVGKSSLVLRFVKGESSFLIPDPADAVSHQNEDVRGSACHAVDA
jgi:GTPase SAR1 family protein